MKPRTLILAAIILCPALLCGRGGAADAPATQPAVAVPATIEPFWSADLYAKDSGYVTDVNADIGDHVTRGQVLAVIDDPELTRQLDAANAMLKAKQQMVQASEAAVQQSKSALEVAKSQLAGLQVDRALADATFKRQQELFSGKAITDQQLDEVKARQQVAAAQTEVGRARVGAAEADITAAQANLAVAQAQAAVADVEVQRLQTLLQYTKIIAPFDGVVVRRQVSPGDLTQAATSSRTFPLFTCQRIDTVRVFCDVPELSAAAVGAGQPVSVKVYALDGKTISGSVTRLSPSLNPETRTRRAEIDLPNPGERLLPGMYTQVTLSLRPPVAESTPVKP